MAIKPAGRGPELIAVYSFFIGLTTIAVVLRTYCRVYLVKNFALDDWLCITAWVFLTIFSCFAINGAHHGTGQHAWDIQPSSEIPIGLKWWWACEPIYVLSNMAIKGSIAVMLLRLTVERIHRLIIWITIIITEIYALFFFFLFILQCQPSSYFWTQWVGGKGKCINPMITVNSTYAYSAITCAGDWIFAILPFFLVWKLQMEKRQKYLVALILAMGAIASTATIIRIPYLSSLSNQKDFLYATLDVAIWSVCETGLGITAASGATLRPLFREVNFLATSHRTHFTGAYGPATATHRPGLGPTRRTGLGPTSLGRWPSGAGNRSYFHASGGRATPVDAEELGQVEHKIRATTQVSVEDYGYSAGHGHIANQYSESSNTSETGITGKGSDNGKAKWCTRKAKPLPDIPYADPQQSRFWDTLPKLGGRLMKDERSTY